MAIAPTKESSAAQCPSHAFSLDVVPVTIHHDNQPIRVPERERSLVRRARRLALSGLAGAALLLGSTGIFEALGPDPGTEQRAWPIVPAQVPEPEEIRLPSGQDALDPPAPTSFSMPGGGRPLAEAEAPSASPSEPEQREVRGRLSTRKAALLILCLATMLLGLMFAVMDASYKQTLAGTGMALIALGGLMLALIGVFG